MSWPPLTTNLYAERHGLLLRCWVWSFDEMHEFKVLTRVGAASKSLHFMGHHRFARPRWVSSAPQETAPGSRRWRIS